MKLTKLYESPETTTYGEQHYDDEAKETGYGFEKVVEKVLVLSLPRYGKDQCELDEDDMDELNKTTTTSLLKSCDFLPAEGDYDDHVQQYDVITEEGIIVVVSRQMYF